MNSRLLAPYSSSFILINCCTPIIDVEVRKYLKKKNSIQLLFRIKSVAAKTWDTTYFETWLIFFQNDAINLIKKIADQLNWFV